MDGFLPAQTDYLIEMTVGDKFFHKIRGMFNIRLRPKLVCFIGAAVLAHPNDLVIYRTRVLIVHKISITGPVRADNRLAKAHRLRQPQTEPFRTV
ncbi:hypothetical protein Pmgp_03832 [Pelotomaculum propionicicum]|uniref:Uncharacterized protein n=1 Tax=Pelotomaculum propionicicum TaxID=258475 RepID=A0A4Y7R8N0_9FIRM|nr:hypothetical protein Pmgp_03832 [Pelotomaculum propionicicum]